MLIEAFSPKIRDFLQLQRVLPEDKPCILVVENNELVVISSNYTTRWSKGQEGIDLKYQTIHSYNDHIICDMAPLVDTVNGLVYTAYKGHCDCITIDGFIVIQAENPL